MPYYYWNGATSSAYPSKSLTFKELQEAYDAISANNKASEAVQDYVTRTYRNKPYDLDTSTTSRQGHDMEDKLMAEHTFKVGDRVKINPSGDYPHQGGEGEGIVIGTTEHGLPVHVKWDNDTPKTNSYRVTDLLLVSTEEVFTPEHQFKIGDVVEVISDCLPLKTGMVGYIGSIDGTGCTLPGNIVTFRYGSGGSINVNSSILKPYTVQDSPDEPLIKQKESEMTKFYKLLTDKPEYVAGAILQGEVGGSYSVISPLLFATEAEEKGLEKGRQSAFYYTFVEDAEDFEQVYQIQHRDGVKYGTKAQAREAMLALNVEPKKSK